MASSRSMSPLRRKIPLMLMLCALGCGPRTQSTTPASTSKPGDGETKTTKVVKDGNKTTIITTTTKMIEAPDPPARPADPFPDDPLVKYNVDQLNSYRKKAGVGALLYDNKLSAFALEGSKQLAIDHKAHAHFVAKVKGAPGFGTKSAENQGDWEGVPAMDKDPIVNGKKQIDVMLKIMFDEGPGGGHHDNMLSTKYARVGIGIFYAQGKLYLTNDFSN
jgi:hypothetical protein